MPKQIIDANLERRLRPAGRRRTGVGECGRLAELEFLVGLRSIAVAEDFAHTFAVCRFGHIARDRDRGAVEKMSERRLQSEDRWLACATLDDRELARCRVAILRCR